MDYLEFNFQVSPKQPWTDLLVSQLAEIGFDSFVEQDEGILAYIAQASFKEELLETISVFELPDVSITYTQKLIPYQNWNKTWESEFEPIEINAECWIRAPFHEMDARPYDVVISPEMAFGTGHHETTFLMSGKLFELSIKNKTLLDMGCGTGVLALLAENLGALNVVAIDIDELAYNNTVLNVSLNKASKIEVEKGDASKIGARSFDIILANINKNILVQDMQVYANALDTNGLLLLSGFFKTDVEEIVAHATKYDLQFVNSTQKNDWALIELKKM
ncbi:MAG: ribosomal protein L11 methyltransferase [Flavobacteriales bacterium]|jgi:ribosomal protein L11 methyltransferase